MANNNFFYPISENVTPELSPQTLPGINAQQPNNLPNGGNIAIVTPNATPPAQVVQQNALPPVTMPGPFSLIIGLPNNNDGFLTPTSVAMSISPVPSITDNEEFITSTAPTLVTFTITGHTESIISSFTASPIGVEAPVNEGFLTPISPVTITFTITGEETESTTSSFTASPIEAPVFEDSDNEEEFSTPIGPEIITFATEGGTTPTSTMSTSPIAHSPITQQSLYALEYGIAYQSQVGHIVPDHNQVNSDPSDTGINNVEFLEYLETINYSGHYYNFN